VPLALRLECASLSDVRAAPATLESIAVPRRRGRARCRPIGLAADRGYDAYWLRDYLRARGIRHSIAQRKASPGKRLRRRLRPNRALLAGRWVVERTFAWLNAFRRLSQRYERLGFIYEAFLHLAAIIICLRRLL